MGTRIFQTYRALVVLVALLTPVVVGCDSLWAADSASPSAPRKAPTLRGAVREYQQSQRILDRLIGFSVSLRPKEQVLKSVAGVKGFATPPTAAASAFRCGSHLVVLRLAEATGKTQMARQEAGLVQQELERLGKPVASLPDGVQGLQPLVEAAVDAGQVRDYYELGSWIETLRVTIKDTLRKDAPVVPQELQAALTVDNLAADFAVRLPQSPTTTSLQQLARYATAGHIGNRELRELAPLLDEIAGQFY